MSKTNVRLPEYRQWTCRGLEQPQWAANADLFIHDCDNLKFRFEPFTTDICAMANVWYSS